MAKRYEVTCIDTRYFPQMTKHSSFSVQLPDIFESREEADKYGEDRRRRDPSVQCSIREVRGIGLSS